MSCQKAQEFLARKKIKVNELVDAKKIRIGPALAIEKVKQSKRLIVFRGKKKWEWNLEKDHPSNEEILKVIIGPSGNLRAPSVRIKDTFVVGFSTDYSLILS